MSHSVMYLAQRCYTNITPPLRPIHKCHTPSCIWPKGVTQISHHRCDRYINVTLRHVFGPKVLRKYHTTSDKRDTHTHKRYTNATPSPHTNATQMSHHLAQRRYANVTPPHTFSPKVVYKRHTTSHIWLKCVTQTSHSVTHVAQMRYTNFTPRRTFGSKALHKCNSGTIL
jgi:hypothetical protein